MQFTLQTNKRERKVYCLPLWLDNYPVCFLGWSPVESMSFFWEAKNARLHLFYSSLIFSDSTVLCLRCMTMPLNNCSFKKSQPLSTASNNEAACHFLIHSNLSRVCDWFAIHFHRQHFTYVIDMFHIHVYVHTWLIHKNKNSEQQQKSSNHKWNSGREYIVLFIKKPLERH